jgi:ATP-dependent DNA helicase UvrD/PcrA
MTPWDLMAALADGNLQIAHTHHLVARFKAVRDEISELGQVGDVQEFVERWLGEQVAADEPFQILARELAAGAETAAGLLEALIAAVALPDVPPDVAEVRIMSLHKSKGLSSPVVIIAGCVEGLLPPAPGTDATPAERQAQLEEQRRLFFVGLTRVKATPADNRPGVLLLTSSRSMALADAMQSGIRPAKVHYGRAFVLTSRFIKELGPAAPGPKAG